MVGVTGFMALPHMPQLKSGYSGKEKKTAPTALRCQSKQIFSRSRLAVCWIPLVAASAASPSFSARCCCFHHPFLISMCVCVWEAHLKTKNKKNSKRFNFYFVFAYIFSGWLLPFFDFRFWLRNKSSFLAFYNLYYFFRLRFAFCSHVNKKGVQAASAVSNSQSSSGFQFQFHFFCLFL